MNASSAAWFPLSSSFFGKMPSARLARWTSRGRPPRAAISPKGARPLLEVTGTALPLLPIKTRRARYPFTTNTCDGPSKSFPSASWCNLKGLELGCQRRADAPQALNGGPDSPDLPARAPCRNNTLPDARLCPAVVPARPQPGGAPPFPSPFRRPRRRTKFRSRTGTPPARDWPVSGAHRAQDCNGPRTPLPGPGVVSLQRLKVACCCRDSGLHNLLLLDTRGNSNRTSIQDSDHGYKPSITPTGQPRLWTSHSTRPPVTASTTLANGHARQTLQLVQSHCQERSRTDTRDAQDPGIHFALAAGRDAKGVLHSRPTLRRALEILPAELVLYLLRFLLTTPQTVQHVEGDVHSQVGEQDSVHLFHHEVLHDGQQSARKHQTYRMATVIEPPQKSTTTNAGMPQKPRTDPRPEFTNAARSPTPRR